MTRARDDRRFYGKYRGQVANNVDPKQMGRVQVSCPSVLGKGKLSWAMPCTPYGGKGVGLFAIPPTGANVWVEFEGGNIDWPIWSGCFWGLGEAPAQPALAEVKMFQTESVSLTMSDLPGAGGVILEIKPPAVAVAMKATFQQDAITIENAPCKLTLTPKEATLTLTPASVAVAPNGITLKLDPASLALSPSEVAVACGTGEAKVAPAAVELVNGAGSVKVAAAGVDAVNGGMSVKVGPASVNINSGALEVT